MTSWLKNKFKKKDQEKEKEKEDYAPPGYEDAPPSYEESEAQFAEPIVEQAGEPKPSALSSVKAGAGKMFGKLKGMVGGGGSDKTSGQKSGPSSDGVSKSGAAPLSDDEGGDNVRGSGGSGGGGGNKKGGIMSSISKAGSSISKASSNLMNKVRGPTEQKNGKGMSQQQYNQQQQQRVHRNHNNNNNMNRNNNNMNRSSNRGNGGLLSQGLSLPPATKAFLMTVGSSVLLNKLTGGSGKGMLNQIIIGQLINQLVRSPQMVASLLQTFGGVPGMEPFNQIFGRGGHGALMGALQQDTQMAFQFLKMMQRF